MLPQLIRLYRNEPLRRATKDHRILTAPAVRIGVCDALLFEQESVGTQLVDDFLIGFPDAQPCNEGCLRQEAAIIPHRVVDLQAIFDAHLIVFLAMTGRRMHTAGPLFEGDMIAQDEERIALDERMSSP